MTKTHPVSPEWTWIALDAVGTLIDPDPPVATAYHRIGRAFGSSHSEDVIAERFRCVFRQLECEEIGEPSDWARKDRLRTDEAHERERWRRIVGSVLDDVRDPEGCFRSLYEHFALPRSWRCYADVDGALRRLSDAGFRLAIASNFDRRLNRIRAGLQELAPVEECVISTEVGCRKPSLYFFRGLCARLSCAAHDVLLVGDDEANDTRGGQAAGLAARRLRRDGGTGKHEFATLGELADSLCKSA